MLSAEDQALLTGVGPDSDCGRWLRSFWFPVAISDRWDGPTAQLRLDEPLKWKGRAGTAASIGEEVGTFTGKPLETRILGEDLVL